MREAITELQHGLPGLRGLFHGAGYVYANSSLALPSPFDATDFCDAPRLIAQTEDESLVVLFFPLKRLDTEREALACRRVATLYPRSLFLFTDAGCQKWDIFCPSLETPTPGRFRLSLDLNNATDAQLAVLNQIFADADDGVQAHQRISALLAQQVMQQKAPAAEREGKLQETMSWWLNIVGKYPVLTAEEEKRLVRRVARGDAKAQELLILSNLRLVVSIAREYPWSFVPLSDLIQEGNLGLIHAVEKYDYRKGYRFSTYATHWIKQRIGRAIENFARLIRFPSHLITSLSQLRQARTALEAFLGRDPSVNEIAARLDVSVQQAQYWMELEAEQILSLDEPMDTGVSCFGDFLPANREFAPDVRIDWRTICNEIEESFLILTPRERQVLTLRFGLTEKRSEPATLEEIGQVLQLSRERARQIEVGALRKLQLGEIGWRLRECVFSGDWHAVPPIGAAVDEASLTALRETKEKKNAQLIEVRHLQKAATQKLATEITVVQKPAPQEILPKDRLVRQSPLYLSAIRALCQKLGKDARLRDVAQLTQTDLHFLPGIGKGKIRALIELLADAGLMLREETATSMVDPPGSPPSIASIISGTLPAPMPKREEVSLFLFGLEETSQTVCQNCGAPVVLKPTIVGKWYRCKGCKDTRVLSAST